MSDSHRDKITLLRNRKRGQPASHFNESCASVAMIRLFDVQSYCSEAVALVRGPSVGLTPVLPTLLNGISSCREVVVGQEST